MTTRDDDADVQAALDRREREVQERVDQADHANQTALDSLSVFMREIVIARKLLARPISPADAMLAARENFKEHPP